MSLFLTDHKLKARNHNFTLTTTLQPILSFSRRRVQVYVINTSATTAYICRERTGSAATGVPIIQNAAMTWSLLFLDDCIHEFYGLTAADTANIRVEETLDMAL